MGVFSSLGGIVGGNRASKAIKESAMQTQQFAKDQNELNRGENQPFLDFGTDSINALRNILIDGDEGAIQLRPGEESLRARSMRDTESRLAARGLGDSGAGRNVLLDTDLRFGEQVRGNRINELFAGAGFGENALNRNLQSSAMVTNQVANTNSQIGQANAFKQMNLWNGIGGLADQAAGAAMGAFGGMPGMGGLSGFSGGETALLSQAGALGEAGGGGGFSWKQFGSNLFNGGFG